MSARESFDSKTLQSLKYCLRDLQPDTEAKSTGYATENGVQITDQEEPLPEVIFLALVVVLRYRFFGQEEKVAWSIPVLYRGVRFLLSHRKFGFRIHTPEPALATPELVQQLVKTLNRASKIADQLMEPLIEERVRQGDVLVQNQYPALHQRYRFFREKAEEAFRAPPPEPEVVSRDENGAPQVITEDPFRPQREGYYYAQAMLDAYFSLLEHELVLLLPFAGFDPAKEYLPALMSADWASKFMRVLPFHGNPAAQRFFNRLQELKEKFRNVLAHGGFEKRGASLFCPLPIVGAVPVRLSGFRRSIHFSLFPIMLPDFDEISQTLDDFDDSLRQGPLGRGFRIGEAGFDIRFDEKGIEEYRKATETGESLERWLEIQERIYEIEANMNWG